MDMEGPITLEQGWLILEKGITKLRNGVPDPQEFSVKDYMNLYVTAYTMCTQRYPQEYSGQLYAKYRESIQEYITTTVLPSLKQKRGKLLCGELVERWENHKVMVRLLCHIFRYIDRYYVPRRNLPPLKAVGLECFRDLVLREFEGVVKHTVVVSSLVDREIGGKLIDDLALQKTVEDISIEIGGLLAK